MDNKEKYFYEEINLTNTTADLRRIFLEGTSRHIDGFTACHLKHRLFLYKSLIDEFYNQMPEFPDQEREWEEERSKHQMWRALKYGK